jgi:hypothetical protein
VEQVVVDVKPEGQEPDEGAIQEELNVTSAVAHHVHPAVLQALHVNWVGHIILGSWQLDTREAQS